VCAAERKSICIGTRESKLALLQTDMVLQACKIKFPDLEFEVVGLSTTGDKVLNKPLSEVGGLGVFVKELEEALLDKRVDFVVHSLKDVPTARPNDLVIPAVLMRDDPRDVLVSRGNIPFEDLPAGCRVATSSRRRAAQLGAVRKDLKFVDIRGNVPTRLRKLDEDHCDAMVLAAAGLTRLGLGDRITQYFNPALSVPAAGQGALAVECRTEDDEMINLLIELDEPNVRAEIMAERAFLARLGGGCSVPIGVLARIDMVTGVLHVTGCVADGDRVLRGEKNGTAYSATSVGIQLAEELIAQGAGQILDSILAQRPQPQISPP
jgi:hydroxymethylbilane synthase